MRETTSFLQMPNGQRVLAALEPTRPLCDDCLAERAGVSPRQTVNQICRHLLEFGRIQRRSDKVCVACRKQKICNWSATTASEATEETPVTTGLDAAKPWFWEGNVQSHLAEWLLRTGWSIQRVADTCARTPGVDIVATRGESELWITVKGYPEKSAPTQAGHWLAGAIFDLVRYRNEREDLQLAIALPDGFPSYLNRVPKTAWLREAMPFRIYWVRPTGEVRCE